PPGSHLGGAGFWVFRAAPSTSLLWFEALEPWRSVSSQEAEALWFSSPSTVPVFATFQMVPLISPVRLRLICSAISRLFSFFSRSTVLESDEQTVEDASAFVRWKNGGGLFHRSARIDPTAVVEVGAVVHPDSVLGSDVRIGSGTVVGPSVSIRQSTKVG
ncbi:hypothetical protein BHE74_00056392, partial [Ensete ventricosum]